MLKNAHQNITDKVKSQSPTLIMWMKFRVNLLLLSRTYIFRKTFKGVTFRQFSSIWQIKEKNTHLPIS